MKIMSTSERHLGTRVRYVIQRKTSRLDWTDGLNEARVSDSQPYPDSFRTLEDGKAALGAARRRATRYGRRVEYRLVRHVTEFTVVS